MPFSFRGRSPGSPAGGERRKKETLRGGRGKIDRTRRDETVTVMVGPPRDRADDERLVRLFLARPGKKAVCGGTTSQIVGRFLGEPVETRIDYADPAVPPIGYLKGIDLVTEGVLTIGHAVELLEREQAPENPAERRFPGRDGASLLLRLLAGEAARVDFLMGRAVNPACRNPATPIRFNSKQRLVEKLARLLEQSGKQVIIRYF